MFITFGKFIGLIIITIIMILLIIYLTLTSGKKDPQRQRNTYNPEKEAKTRLAQNNPEAKHSIPFNSNESHYGHDNIQTTTNDTHYYNQPPVEEPIEDDSSLHVLPYPKDDDFK